MIGLSIIVPVYNKVKYLDECISSILNQTFTDFELILVNDGSTDGSDLICRKHANLDPRILVITQQNSGVSAARNAGLKIARGKFTGFVDSDDTIQSDMYELLIKNIERHDADISVCRLQSISPDVTQRPVEKQGIYILDHKQGVIASLNGDLDRSANNKIYKTELAREEKFEGKIYEDILYTNKIFLKTSKTVVEDIVKYNYMIRDNSASMQSFNADYQQTINTSALIVELVDKNDPDCLPAAYTFDVATNLAFLNLILLSGLGQNSDLYARVVANIRNYYVFIKSSNSLTRKQKYALKAFEISPTLYKYLLLLYCKIMNAYALKRTII